VYACGLALVLLATSGTGAGYRWTAVAMLAACAFTERIIAHKLLNWAQVGRCMVLQFVIASEIAALGSILDHL
jgi:hypothetical protein